jgi:hypothetical protein
MAKVGWETASGNGHASGFVRIVRASPLQQRRALQGLGAIETKEPAP